MAGILKNYVKGDFTLASKVFNFVAGNSYLQYDNIKDFADALVRQLREVREETVETIMAIGEDKAEVLDGGADILFTSVYLNEMLAYGYERFGSVELGELFKEMGRLEQIVCITSIFPIVLLAVYGVCTEQQVVAACKRVAINNTKKYTSDKQEFDSWRKPEGALVRETEIDGVVYYALASKEGKILKHLDFEKVELEDLLEDN